MLAVPKKTKSEKVFDHFSFPGFMVDSFLLDFNHKRPLFTFNIRAPERFYEWKKESHIKYIMLLGW